jgi:hypothetical protein
MGGGCATQISCTDEFSTDEFLRCMWRPMILCTEEFLYWMWITIILYYRSIFSIVCGAPWLYAADKNFSIESCGAPSYCTDEFLHCMWSTTMYTAQMVTVECLFIWYNLLAFKLFLILLQSFSELLTTNDISPLRLFPWTAIKVPMCNQTIIL